MKRWWIALVVVVLATGCAWAGKAYNHPCQTGRRISCSRIDGGGFYQDDATGKAVKYVGKVVWSGPFEKLPPLPYVPSPPFDGTEKGFWVRPWPPAADLRVQSTKGMEMRFPAHGDRWYTEAQIVAALEMYDDVKAGRATFRKVEWMTETEAQQRWRPFHGDHRGVNGVNQ